MNTTPVYPEPVNAIVSYAVQCSVETRERIAQHRHGILFDRPAADWRDTIEERAAELERVLTEGGAELVAAVVPAARQYVRLGVDEAAAAVRELATYVPRYASRPLTFSAPSIGIERCEVKVFEPTDATLAKLDELRAVARLKLLELQSLFEEHASPLARILSVGRRVAEHEQEPTAKLVARWFAKLERGEHATT